ncbi:metal ABC transporter permease [Candidatus Tenderia electrophaga]|jgi:ATP-binding cassette subfamily B protein|uniref:Metal ABC transporter permease n=1 Tax=Candidatus Tenderia electrophaga TaxID=1748243 RepID=A0A0S2TBN5_9GAMM|nr:metal ABC transporter permease [Candidatus Tenderia electrophaga]
MRSFAEHAPAAPRNDWQTLRSLIPYLWEHKPRVMLALVCLMLAKVATVTMPWFLKHIVDHLSAEDVALTLPLTLLLGYGAMRLATSGFGELRDAIFARVTQSSIRRVALQVFRHLHRLSLRFHLERQTGGVSRDIERGSRGISFLLNFMVFNILPTLFEIGLVTLILLINYDVWFALITLASVSVYIAFSLLVTEWRMRFRRTMNELDSKANTRAIDSLLNYETVKYFGNEAYEARRYDQNMEHWQEAAIKNQTSLSLLNFGQGFIVAGGMTALLILAADGVVKGEMTIGDLVLINAYLLQLFMPLNFLGFVYREIKHSLADMEKMFNLLRNNPDVQDKADARPLQISRGEVRFEHVDFGYNPNRQILHDVSFDIPPGKKVAVVGHSGAGKSTLSRILFRFYEIDAGRILIDGQDIRDVTQQSLRAAIGIVPQDTVLFNDSIKYNIQYGRPDAGDAEIIQAAKTAHIHEFIESLPEGYDTTVGERGLKLSGGEKQRIAIARTVLKDPHILVFDEATSALDSKSEQAILKELKAVAQDHTTLVIAHRLSTVIDADQILVMEQGRIVERGSHRQLLDRDEIYAHMWALQQQEQQQTQSEFSPPE